MMTVIGATALVGMAAHSNGQAPVIASFKSNGELVCTNLQPGSTASVVWASTLLGPWTNSSPGPDAVTADANGAIRVSVPVLSWGGPMFCRVLGTPPPTNPPAPAGMVLIPAGPFVMGDTLDGISSALPLHTNHISAFYMDKYDVTKALWDEVRTWALTNGYSFGIGSPGFGKATNHPVQTVAWFDCVKWCNARSEKARLVPAYYTSPAQTTVYRTGRIDVQNDWVKWSSGYRLPTEAEWEKAARGGVAGMRFPWADTNVITHSRANYVSITSYAYDTSPTTGAHPAFATGASPYTSPVDYFAPNGYGLYDMAGNVWQLCWDKYGSYSAAPETDPRGPGGTSSLRVARGGDWYGLASHARCAYRNQADPNQGYYNFGFRCVRGL